MTDPKKATSDAPPQGAPADDKAKVTAGTLREMIRDEIKNVAGSLFPGTSGQDATGTGASGSGTATQAQQSSDVKGEVARALESLRGKEKRDARDAKLDELLAAHEAAQKTPEKPPVEQRRVHRIMGWGE